MDTGISCNDIASWTPVVVSSSLSRCPCCACPAHRSRLITGEADKTIKIWKEDTTASPESHPIDMAAWTTEWRALKRR